MNILPACVLVLLSLPGRTSLSVAAEHGAGAGQADVIRAEDAPKVLTGVLLDARGRVPLPEYTLEIRAGNHLERVTTEATGRFTSSQPFALGPVTIQPIDNESTASVPTIGGLELPTTAPGPLTPEWKGTPLEVVIACGPTFDLTWKPLVDEADPPALGACVARVIAMPPGAVDEGAQLSSVVRSGSDGHVWVRFAALPDSQFARPCATRIEIRTADGLWKAEADVTKAIDERTRGLELTWRPSARWTGSLRDSKGRGVPRTWVTLTRTSDSGVVLERRRTRCDVQGRFEFVGLEPGTWKLNGHPLRYHEFSSEKRTLAPRENSKLSVALDAERKLANVKGRALGIAVVEGAKPPEGGKLVVRRAGETLPLETIGLQWMVEEGHYVAPFVIQDLPQSDFEVELIPPGGDEKAWEVPVLHVKPGPDPITFLRR